MALDLSFEYDENKNILIYNVCGDMLTKDDAKYVFETLKKKITQIGKKVWYVSNVTKMKGNTESGLAYGKLTRDLTKHWHASVSIVNGLTHKAGLKLLGTFRKETIHGVYSKQEALDLIEKLKAEKVA